MAESVEATPRGASEVAGVTPRDDAPMGPTGVEREAGGLRRGEPPRYEYDSIGRKYPCDEYGRRVVTGSRRPKGVPPAVLERLPSKGKAKTLERPAEGRGSASSIDGVGALHMAIRGLVVPIPPTRSLRARALGRHG